MPANIIDNFLADCDICALMPIQQTQIEEA